MPDGNRKTHRPMKKIITLFALVFIVLNLSAQSGFLDKQKRYKHVRTAIDEKKKTLINTLREKHIELDELNILVVAYKYESEFEIFAKKKTDTMYQKIAAYKICAKSGDLGPKRKQGDLQVPEGFYYLKSAG